MRTVPLHDELDGPYWWDRPCLSDPPVPTTSTGARGGSPSPPLLSQPVCSLSCRSASPLPDGAHTHTHTHLMIAFERHGGHCQTIHLALCGAQRWTFSQSPFISALYFFFFGLFFFSFFSFLSHCNVPALAHTQKKVVIMEPNYVTAPNCAGDFYPLSLRWRATTNLQPFVYGRVSTRNCCVSAYYLFFFFMQSFHPKHE